MIEHLLESEKRFGEPEYSHATAEILRASKALAQRLDTEGAAWLEKLSESYIRREQTIMESVSGKASAGPSCWRRTCWPIGQSDRRITVEPQGRP